MSTTCETPVALHFTVPGIVHSLQGGGTYWVSAWPLTTLEVPPRIPEPPVQVPALPPLVKPISAAASYRRCLARNIEDKLDRWAGVVIACVTVSLAVVLTNVLADLISLSAG